MDLLDRMSTRYVRVDLSIALAGAVIRKVQNWAVDPSPEKIGPGLEQDEAIQLVAHFARLRNIVLVPDRKRFALFRFAKGEKPVFAGTTSVNRGSGKRQFPPNVYPLPIVGDEHLSGPSWGRKLALALDWNCVALAKAAKAGAVPSGYRGELPTIGPAVVAIIVGGVAVTVIASVAVYRYLEPEVRVRMAEIEAAAAAYALRIEASRATGIMPPVSPIETANAKAVEEAAGERTKREWGWAAAIAGTIVLVTVGSAYIRNQLG